MLEAGLEHMVESGARGTAGCSQAGRANKFNFVRNKKAGHPDVRGVPLFCQLTSQEGNHYTAVAESTCLKEKINEQRNYRNWFGSFGPPDAGS